MNMNFAQVLANLGPDYAFNVANAARTPADYLFATFLPERNKPTYNAKSGNMTVRSLMAGLVGKDASYPPTGFVEASTFSEQTAKIANEARLSEELLRELQQMIQASSTSNGTPVDMAQEVLNFLNKVILQGQNDTREWARGEALVGGAWTWTFNDKTISVDYGTNALGNLLAARTGNDAYHGSASKFWADIRLIRQKLRGGLSKIVAHPETIDAIVSNDVNNAEAVSDGNGGFTLTKYRTVGGNTLLSKDFRDSVQLVPYGLEGERLDPANQSVPIRVPFLSRGKLLATGKATNRGYQVGMGSTYNELAELELGYTHMGPTVEGGNRSGTWARLYTPENQPMQLVGQGVANIMPVIENPGRIVVATTEMP